MLPKNGQQTTLVLFNKMFQLTEEQLEEIQVLESIYADSFKQNTANPSQYAIDLDTTVGKVVLQIKLVQEYPSVIPEMDISSASHKLEKHDLMKALIQEAEGQVGMAMVFTLVSFVEDWISKRYKSTGAKSLRLNSNNDDSAASSEDSKKPTIIEEKILDSGTPVTRENFLAWKERFLRENVGNLKGASAAFAPIQKESKLTGKQLFEQNKNLAESDAAFADDGIALEIDESAFEGINLDDLEEEDEVFYDNRGQISDEEN